jgi:hypothetical protein
MPERTLNRRELQKLVLAAVGGLAAGSMVGCSGGGAPKPPEKGAAKEGEKATETAADDKPSLLQDPHICRGINTCTNKGKPGTENKCAGQAHCATVASHDCQGQNDCKGHGGCGEHPGENACKGQGSCAVPLSDKTWPIARKHFEELMKAAGKEFGEAPPKA